MSLVAVADRLTKPLGETDRILWLDGDCRRFSPTTILRLTDRAAINHEGDPRPGAPYELVVVLEVLSPFSMAVARSQFGTRATDYPPGTFVDAIARSPKASERPIYRGFEDI